MCVFSVSYLPYVAVTQKYLIIVFTRVTKRSATAQFGFVFPTAHSSKGIVRVFFLKKLSTFMFYAHRMCKRDNYLLLI